MSRPRRSRYRSWRLRRSRYPGAFPGGPAAGGALHRLRSLRLRPLPGELGVVTATSGVDTFTSGVETLTSGVLTVTPGSVTPMLGTVTPMLGSVTPMLGSEMPAACAPVVDGCGSVTPTAGSATSTRGSASSTLGSATLRPCACAGAPAPNSASTHMTVAVAAAHVRGRRMAATSLTVLRWVRARSCAGLGQADGRARGLDAQLDGVHQGGHQREPPATLGVRGDTADGHDERPVVANRQRQEPAVA